MLKQRTTTTKTATATLAYTEMGDIVVDSSSAVEISLPTPSPGLWYRISNVNSGLVTVSYGSELTTLKQTEQCLCLSNASADWYFSKGAGAMTKAEIEAVLTGVISSHSHAPEGAGGTGGIVSGNLDGGTPSSTYSDDAAFASDMLIPIGGTAGQVLMKNSSTDRDVKWGTVSSGNLDGGTPSSTYSN